MLRKQFAMDRSQSGAVDFSRDFPALTVAPVDNAEKIHLRLFVDRCSVEAFGENGRYAMTNLVFPSDTYNKMTFESDKKSFIVKSLKIYRLK